jgi:dynein light chain LC8-type
MAEESEAAAPGVEVWRHMWGAKVQWPAEMPDDMLKTVIGTVSRAWFCACPLCWFSFCPFSPPTESTRDKLDPIADWQTQGDDVVQALKSQFDAAWGPSWHVVIGKNFGSRVTHEARKMTFFYYEDKACLVFKA